MESELMRDNQLHQIRLGGFSRAQGREKLNLSASYPQIYEQYLDVIPEWMPALRQLLLCANIRGLRSLSYG
jgi:hypothetical protein